MFFLLVLFMIFLFSIDSLIVLLFFVCLKIFDVKLFLDLKVFNYLVFLEFFKVLEILSLFG